MNKKTALLACALALIAGVAGVAAERALITFRRVIFDTTFLQGHKGTPKLDDIVLDNLKEEIVLRGVFAMPPKYHVDICMLIEAKTYNVLTFPPHLVKPFDENIYSDAVLRLKDDSLCRVQHSYRKDDGLTIRIVRDGLMAYIRPNKPSAGDVQ
jgi:hypothetical protein